MRSMTRSGIIIVAMFISSLFDVFGYALAAQYINVIAAVLTAFQLERIIKHTEKSK